VCQLELLVNTVYSGYDVFKKLLTSLTVNIVIAKLTVCGTNVIVTGNIAINSQLVVTRYAMLTSMDYIYGWII